MIDEKGQWTLDDIEWDKFDASKVDPDTLKAVKAAAMVEFNSADYVDYLNKVFAGDPEVLHGIAQWGIEERQHGEALGKWAEMADPDWNFETAFAHFKKGYQINEGAEESVRGSRAGEMIARCVVESGTSTFYSGMRDKCEEPVLQQIARRIAADEFRHYKLFYEGYLRYAPEDKPSFFQRFMIAAGRVQEAEDDELAYAYYSANVPVEEQPNTPYVRDTYSKLYNGSVMRFYHEIHTRKAVEMICKAVGLKPKGVITQSLAKVFWWVISSRTPSKPQTAAA